MVIDRGSLLDNTRLIPSFMADQPGTYLRARGFQGLRGNVWDLFDESVDPRSRGGVTEAPNPLHIRNRSLGRLGWDAGMDGLGDDASGATNITMQDIKDLVPQLNAEALYLINLNRAQQGLQPLSSTTYGPSVNVGLSATAMIGIAAIAFALLKR